MTRTPIDWWSTSAEIQRAKDADPQTDPIPERLPLENARLQEELKRTRQELLLLYEIGNLIRKSLLLDEVIYLILSAVTSHEGLGFNRAMLFMVDDTGTQLDGKMGIGATSPDVTACSWKAIEQNSITLEGLLDVYRKADRKIDIELNAIIRQIRLPMKASGALQAAVMSDKPSLILSNQAKCALSDIQLANLNIQEFAVVPLRGKDHVLGALLVDNVATHKPIRKADVRRVVMLANHAGLALENAKCYSEAVIHSQQDSLTGLWNYGHFHRLLEECLCEGKKAEQSVGLVLFDVDNFKAYNDSFGHQAGDYALDLLGQSAKTVMRRTDHLARYGGEEFAAILPNTAKVEAVNLAERLRKSIDDATALPDCRLHRRLTVSVGVSCFPEDTEVKDKLISYADGALYNAKRSGKNRVCLHNNGQRPSSIRHHKIACKQQAGLPIGIGRSL